MEEGVNINIPSTIHSIAQFLNSTRETQDPRMYTQLVATLAFTAEKAKFATGNERQEWMDLFIDTFKMVHSEIVGDPETVLGLCWHLHSRRHEVRGGRDWSEMENCSEL